MAEFWTIVTVAAVASFAGYIVGFVAGYNATRLREYLDAMRGWGRIDKP